MRRRGLTVAEVLLAFGILSLILGGAVLFLSTSTRQRVQLVAYTTSLQAAASIADALERDLDSAYVPPGARADNGVFDVGASGLLLRLLRYPRREDPAAAPADGGARYWVQWTAQPQPDGSYVIRREARGQETVWQDVRAKEVRFEVRQVEEKVVLVVQMLVEDREAGTDGKAFQRGLVPLRVVRDLPVPGRLGPGTRPEAGA
jgi:type II secretory pathway pseudopilin PulG